MKHGRCHRGLAPRQVQGSQRVGGLRQLLEAGEQLFGVFEPALHHAELGELSRRVYAARSQVGCLHGPQTLGEHPVGHLPIARR